MFPGETTFVKAIGILEIIPVPQSGPIISKPFSCANFFKRTSSSIDTLSVKENTCKSFFKARSISGAPYSPGILNSATFASGKRSNASDQEVAACVSSLVPFADKSSKNSSIAGITSSMMFSFSLSTTIIMSFADALLASSVNKFVLLRMSLLASVPIMI